MPTPEMPIFTRTFDLLTWLMQATNHFPRAHRHTLTRRLLDAALDLRERLEEAHLRRGGERLDRLSQADDALALSGGVCVTCSPGPSAVSWSRSG